MDDTKRQKEKFKIDLMKLKVLRKLEFTGKENVYDFIEEFECFSEILFTTEAKILYFEKSLVDKASKFYSDSCINLPIAEIINLFRIKFEIRITLDDIMTKLESLKMKSIGTIEQYIELHKKYLNEYKNLQGKQLNDEMAKYYFYGGLEREFKNNIKRRDPIKIDDCYRFSKIEYDLMNEISDEENNEDKYNLEVIKKLRNERKELKSMAKEINTMKVENMRNPPSNKYSPHPIVNNISTDNNRITQIKSNGENRLRSKKCKYITRLNKILIQKTRKLNCDIMLTASIGDRSFRFLIDKSCKISLIDKLIAKDILNRGQHSWSRKINNLKTTSNELLPPEVKFTTKLGINIGHKYKRKDTTFISTDVNNNKYDGILGQNFLKMFKISITNDGNISFSNFKDDKANLEKAKTKKIKENTVRRTNNNNSDSLDIERRKDFPASISRYSHLINKNNPNFNQRSRWKDNNLQYNPGYRINPNPVKYKERIPQLF